MPSPFTRHAIGALSVVTAVAVRISAESTASSATENGRSHHASDEPLTESASCDPLADFHAHVIPDSGDELKPRFIRYLYPYALAMIAGVSVPHVRCDTFYP